MHVVVVRVEGDGGPASVSTIVRGAVPSVLRAPLGAADGRSHTRAGPVGHLSDARQHRSQHIPGSSSKWARADVPSRSLTRVSDCG